MTQGQGQFGILEGIFQMIAVSKYEDNSLINNQKINTLVHFGEKRGINLSN
jgi:hypothetical protein